MQKVNGDLGWLGVIGADDKAAVSLKSFAMVQTADMVGPAVPRCQNVVLTE